MRKSPHLLLWRQNISPLNVATYIKRTITCLICLYFLKCLVSFIVKLKRNQTRTKRYMITELQVEGQVENSNFSSFSIYDIYYRSASETNILSKQTAGGQKLRPKILKGINSKMLYFTQPLSTERWYSKVMVFNIRPTTLHWISSAISLTKTMF